MVDKANLELRSCLDRLAFLTGARADRRTGREAGKAEGLCGPGDLTCLSF